MNDQRINLETANAQLKKVFAPWIQNLNLVIEAIDGGEVVMRLPYSDDLCRSHEIVCGQAMMALIDTCMVFVCYLGQRGYGNCTTVSQSTSFMRPVIGQDIIATGRIVKAGRQLVFGEVSLHSANDERVVCQGTSTYMVLPD
ncbi:MAG: hypothetical protein ACI9XU_000485 [Arenicella sp.]|jgi:uncharacterized protein (TIGR00369 family)